MFNPKCEITLVSQLLDSINDHLQLVYSPMKKEEEESSEHPVAIEPSNNDDDDELWLSDHRSIFSSYGNDRQKTIPSLRDSQYEGFHWDVYGNENYHQLVFEYDQQHICQPTRLSEWSMHLDSDMTEDDDDVDDTTSSSDPPRTSWQAIKTQSIHLSCSSTNTSDSEHYSPHPLTLYRLFQRSKSQQHPCRLYQNFSDKSLCDSSISSSSSSSSCSTSHKIPMSKVKLKSPTNFSPLNIVNPTHESKSNVDQCLQTSLILAHINKPLVSHSKSTERLLNNPSSQSSFTSDYTLPDLDFLSYYAKENPPQLSTLTYPTHHCCTPMKRTLFQPLTPRKKSTRTVFYCSMKLPNRPSTLHSSLSTNKHIKPCSTTISADETEAFSSICSSSTSSGYFSNCSTNQIRHMQTVRSLHPPLKSCLKRTKTKANVLAVGLAGDLFTLTTEHIQHENNGIGHRCYSAPTTPSHEQNLSLQFRTKDPTCTLSEHDLSAKKSVSFSNEIARRLITPSNSPKRRYQDYCDLLPRESLTDSPPSEFNLSDDDEHDDHLVNFTDNASEHVIKPLPIKNGSDKYLIDAFAATILRILEIKCNDPKSYYLNNQSNPELDRILRLDFCLLLREVLEDGLRQHSGSLFSRKVHLWRLIELTTPTTGRFHEAKLKAHGDLSSNADWIEKFNSFIYHLLNLHELPSWLTHFIFHRTILKTYYESWAFVLVNNNNQLFECITNQLEKLSPLPFRLKYTSLSNSRILLTSPRSSITTIPRRFNVRGWLRDRKTQVKISPKEFTSSILPNACIRRKLNSIPVLKRH